MSDLKSVNVQGFGGQEKIMFLLYGDCGLYEKYVIPPFYIPLIFILILILLKCCISTKYFEDAPL